jgi:hypothetical protein
MGVRISIYAVDVPSFEAFIDQPIGDALWRYAENGSDRERIIYWTDMQRERSYRAAPGEPLKYEQHSAWIPLTKASISEHPFLKEKIRDYLARDHSFSLMWLLRGLSRFPPTDFVREITTGYRRWWIGSLLDYAERAPDISGDDFARFVSLCQKILRGRDCGRALPEREIGLADFSFPVIPCDDTDLWIGVWSEDESRFALDFLRRIEHHRPRFKRPPGPIGIAPESEDEWDKWVHEMIRQVLVIAELKFDRPNVLTFIDS